MNAALGGTALLGTRLARFFRAASGTNLYLGHKYLRV